MIYMNGEQRRNELLNTIKRSCLPISGTQLAKDFSVSRQVIVQDIALLRSSGFDIISTNRGYIILFPEASSSRIFKIQHSDDQTEDELCTIIDLGGYVLDVFVNHRAYGIIRGELQIKSRKHIASFLEDLKTGRSTPLKNITSNYHYHTVSADDEQTLDEIYQALKSKGYLAPLDEWDHLHILKNK